MKAKRAASELLCGLNCAAEKSCTSINYKTSGSGNGRWELNNKIGEETSYVDGINIQNSTTVSCCNRTG